MNPQFKRGVLELIVLLVVDNQDVYGYELVQEVSKVVEVNEGTIYPLLRRLTNEKYFTTYIKESNEGPSRKYYSITELGCKRAEILLNQWLSFSEEVNKFIKESDFGDKKRIHKKS